jgi:HSP20 family molecular chaperone IbpA
MTEHTLEVQKEEAQTPEGVERTRTGRTYIPRVDIYESEDEVVLLADLPGVDENSLDITLEKNVLTIEGYVQFEEPEGYELAH